MIVRPGENCWRVERADRFHCIQDAADYFQFVRYALLGARRTVFMLGWDIFAGLDLVPGSSPSDAPTRLDELLAFVARRRPGLRCYILIWDHAALYTLERDPLSRWRLGWRMPRQVRFAFDDRHPIGASHHQKVIVVDDRLAFSGGIDLTGHRWDTAAHRVEEPARVNATGTPYDPYHDLQAMVTGPVAVRLGELARDRWRALGEVHLPKVESGDVDDLWPNDLTPDLTDVNVAIARTMPASDIQPAARECESLFVDSIAAARRSIYIESQYFTNDALSAALAARLRESDGPEVVVVAPKECHGWLEQNTMGAFRDRNFKDLKAADRHGRLRLVYPLAARAQDVPTFVHSKAMVVDDVLVRIGSANFSRRSMGVDTECDLAVDAGTDARVRAGVRRIRDKLLGEHLGLPAETLGAALEHAGSVRALIDSRQHAERTLAPIEVAGESETPSEALRAAADPDEPLQFAWPAAELLPPIDARASRARLRLWMPALALTIVVVSTSSALARRPEFRSMQEALAVMADAPWWIGAAVFLLATVALIPAEVSVIAAGVVFGGLRGGLVALVGSISAAIVGYLVGRALGPSGVTRWISRRSYRSVRRLGARGVAGVVILRLTSVASAGAVHLLCGAGRVPFVVFMTGSVIGLTPVIAALSALGGLLGEALLSPSRTNVLQTIAATLLVIGVAAGLRAFLLIRQFAPRGSRQRNWAEFG